jgi:hypothetical protein
MYDVPILSFEMHQAVAYFHHLQNQKKHSIAVEDSLAGTPGLKARSTSDDQTQDSMSLGLPIISTKTGVRT